MLSITLDWLAGTFHGETQHETRFINQYARHSVVHAINPRNGYNAAEVDSNGVQLLWNTNRDEMGTHIIFPGSSLRSLYENQDVQLATLLHDFTYAGAKISRLDLAKDFTGRQIDLEKVYKRLEQGFNRGTARTYSKVQSNDNGFTVYVGSRTSEKFIRIYDKAAQTGQSNTAWFRFELECKGMVARAVATSLIQTKDWAGVFDGASRGMLDLRPNDALADFYALDTVPIGLPKIEKQTDREKWIETQVIEAVAKYYIENPNSEAVARLIATLQLIDRQRKE